MRSTRVSIKYMADRVIAIVLLFVLSPLLLVIAAAVRILDGGPVIFKHSRPGVDGEPFEVWKFRTMVVDADRLLADDGTPTAPRVTPLGRWLRRLSLDELPQLLNIVRGEMSFVGPRPAIMEHLDRYTDAQRGRLRMRPGITGLAQVNGRNTLKWSERIRYDNEYIDNYSFAMDLRILIRTVGVALRGSGVAADRNPGEVDDLGPPRTATDEGASDDDG